MDSQRLEPEDLRRLLSDRTRLVCFTHASNILGETLPVAEITRMVHDHGARVVVDGVAYAPHRPIDVRDWGVDFYAFSLYKVYGPHCAVLYVRGSEMESLANLNHEFMDRSHGPGKLEPGAFPYELLYGARGVPQYLRELSGRIAGDKAAGSFGPAYAAIGAHEHRLSSRLLSYLAAEPAVRIIGDERPGPARLPTISFVVRGCRSSEIPVRLDPQGIGIRWGHFYAPRLIERLGLTERDGVVRVSMVHYNTLEEVDRLISGLTPLLSGAAS
jgi:selenocysteine lyase/cysteine desulfurase